MCGFDPEREESHTAELEGVAEHSNLARVLLVEEYVHAVAGILHELRVVPHRGPSRLPRHCVLVLRVVGRVPHEGSGVFVEVRRLRVVEWDEPTEFDEVTELGIVAVSY